MTADVLPPSTPRDALIRSVTSGALLDLLLSLLLFAVGVPPTSAQLLAFVIAWPLVLQRSTLVRSLRAQDGHRSRTALPAIASLGVITVLARGALLANMLEHWPLPPTVLIVAAVLIGACGFALTVVEFERTYRTGRPLSWGTIATILVLSMLLGRLAFLGLPELIPEEAYYWLYAQHLAPGYLDHPPMVAWLIALGGTLFGHSEFAVRIGALLCWCIAAVYLSRLATLLFDRAVAWLSVALFSVLPIFAGIGFTISPDAPLVAAWMVALFYLYQAAVGGHARAWYAMGVAVGLGMLSKYTIVLLAPTALLVVLLDPPARMWLRRREPYLGGLIALALFSPVVYWNATHDWASFAFQGPRRFEMRTAFAVHRYLLDLVVLMTPSGIAATCLALSRVRAIDAESALPSRRPDRVFVVAAFLVPFSTFLLYSLRHKTKLNWACPAFLTMLPCIAHQIVRFNETTSSRLRTALQRSWVPTFIGLGLLYTAGLYYVAVGFPGLGYSRLSRRFVGWESLGQHIVEIAQQQERDLGVRPVLVGMDSHDISSELAFYTRRYALNTRGTPETVTGRHLFGHRSLMFRFWDGPDSFEGRPMLLVGRRARDLRDELVTPYFERVNPTQQVTVDRHGKEVATYFYRVGIGFRRPPSSAARNSGDTD